LANRTFHGLESDRDRDGRNHKTRVIRSRSTTADPVEGVAKRSDDVDKVRAEEEHPKVAAALLDLEAPILGDGYNVGLGTPQGESRRRRQPVSRAAEVFDWHLLEDRVAG